MDDNSKDIDKFPEIVPWIGNRDMVLNHLKEGHEQLTETIRQLEMDGELDEEGFLVEMAHTYHHLNTAVNQRHQVEYDIDDPDLSLFYTNREYPKAISAYLRT